MPETASAFKLRQKHIQERAAVEFKPERRLAFRKQFLLPELVTENTP